MQKHQSPIPVLYATYREAAIGQILMSEMVLMSEVSKAGRFRQLDIEVDNEETF
jgi:hypothetical protein